MNRHLAPTSRTSTPSSTHASTRRLLALGAVGVLALTACGGDDDTSSDADTPADATTTETTHDPAAHPSTEATSAPEAGANEIVIDGFAFSGVTEVPVGTTVTVVNQDTAAHTWTATDAAFDSGGLAPGDSFEFTFDQPGTYEYRCNIHTSMTGTIVVTP